MFCCCRLHFSATYHNVNSLADYTLSDPLVDGDILPDTDPYSTILRFFEFSDASWEGETLRAVSAFVCGQCLIPPRSRPPSYVRQHFLVCYYLNILVLIKKYYVFTHHIRMFHILFGKENCSVVYPGMCALCLGLWRSLPETKKSRTSEILSKILICTNQTHWITFFVIVVFVNSFSNSLFFIIVYYYYQYLNWCI